jgi:hypothetical protein
MRGEAMHHSDNDRVNKEREFPREVKAKDERSGNKGERDGDAGRERCRMSPHFDLMRFIVSDVGVQQSPLSSRVLEGEERADAYCGRGTTLERPGSGHPAYVDAEFHRVQKHEEKEKLEDR